MKRNGQKNHENVVDVEFEAVPRNNLEEAVKNKLIEITQSQKGELSTHVKDMTSEQLITLIGNASEDSVKQIKAQVEGAKHFDGCRITYEETLTIEET